MRQDPAGSPALGSRCRDQAHVAALRREPFAPGRRTRTFQWGHPGGQREGPGGCPGGPGGEDSGSPQQRARRVRLSMWEQLPLPQQPRRSPGPLEVGMAWLGPGALGRRPSPGSSGLPAGHGQLFVLMLFAGLPPEPPKPALPGLLFYLSLPETLVLSRVGPPTADSASQAQTHKILFQKGPTVLFSGHKYET